MSTADTKTLTAHCLCKNTAFPITLPTSSFPLEVEICHCGPCRHITGTICNFYAILPPGPGADTASKVAESLTTYDHDGHFTRYFCGTCGSHMLLVDREKEVWAVATGVINQVTDAGKESSDSVEGVFKYEYHNWVEDTKDGGATALLPVIEGKTLRRHARNHPPFTELPTDWKSESSKADSRDSLLAYCHCKGIQLSIQRPDVTIDGYTPCDDPKMTKYVQGREKWVASTCVCDSCRLPTGAEMQSWCFPAPSHIQILPDNEPYRHVFGTAKEYISSSDVQRTFCGVCGATIAYHSNKRPEQVDIALGLLDAESGARAEEWCGWKERPSKIDDGLKRNAVVCRALIEGTKNYVKSKTEK